MLTELLELLEKHVDVNRIEAAEELLRRALNFDQTLERPPIKANVPSKYPEFYKVAYSTEQIHQDPMKMLYNETLSLINTITLKDDSIPMIRANYGVGILPSLFGLESVIIDGGMPWVRHIEFSEIQKLLQSGPPSTEAGFGKQIAETHKLYKRVLSEYPKLSEVVKIYHPDLQGPFDVAHVICGSDIYVYMYEHPQMVHDLMELVTKTYIQYMNVVLSDISPSHEGFNYHWGSLFKGNIVLRNDSAVNVSPYMFEEFIAPYDAIILKEFGSGSVHFCGHADHWLENMLDVPGVCGLNFGYMPNLEFGNSYLNKVYPLFWDKKIPISQYVMTYDEYKAMDKDKYNTGLTLSVVFQDIQQFNEVFEYRKE